MSLYVRLQTSFWSHRKTMRLRALLGDAGLWIPPRLWSYAAESQPDGDFSKFLPEELSLAIGYSGNASAMLEALQQAGFLDGMALHGWAEHNGYHEVFAERAKKAAAARWEKKGKRKDKKGKEPSNASSMKAKGTLEEIENFCLEIGLPKSDGTACFHKWEGNGWTNGKSPIKCWRSTIRAWREQKYLPSQKVGTNGTHPAPRMRTPAEMGLTE